MFYKTINCVIGVLFGDVGNYNIILFTRDNNKLGSGVLKFQLMPFGYMRTFKIFITQ